MHETAVTRSFPEPVSDSHWTVTLEVLHGPHAGKAFTITQHDTFLVGRSQQSHFCLPAKDPYFSRFHFLLEVNPPLCRVVDLQSRNGTLVNGQKVTSIDLKDGDEICGGTTKIRVRIQGAVTDPPTCGCGKNSSSMPICGELPPAWRKAKPGLSSGVTVAGNAGRWTTPRLIWLGCSRTVLRSVIGTA